MAGNVREVPFLEVVHAIGREVRGQLATGQPRGRYREVVNVDLGGRTAVWVAPDRVNECVFFEAKGETTPEVTQAVRRLFPGHTVARADVCEDYEAEGAFARLQALVRAHKGPRVRARYVSLPDDPTEGATWQAGQRGKGSTSCIRVYEKGKQPEYLAVGRPHWVRVELEAHPHYAKDKQAAAHMGPLDFWGLSSWTHRVGEVLTTVEIQRYEAELRVQTFDKTTRYIATKFRRHLEEMLSDLGDWECVGREFAAVWSEEDEARKAG